MRPQKKSRLDGETQEIHEVLERALPDTLRHQTVPSARVSTTASPIIEKALLRQGFKFVDNGARLRFPDGWHLHSLAGYQSSLDQQMVVRDQQGRHRGILSVSDKGPDDNKLMLSPRFNVLVVGTRDKRQVVVNDGGVRTYKLAKIDLQQPTETVRNLVAGVVSNAHPELLNPLTLWDRQIGHTKKGLLANLRSSFAAVDGFTPYGNVQASPQTRNDPLTVRPRFHVSTRRYKDQAYVESQGREVIVDQGQEIVLIDDQARGTRDHILPLFKIPQVHKRAYSRCLSVAEAVTHEVLPDLNDIAAYRNLSKTEIAFRADEISRRINHTLNLPEGQPIKQREIKRRDAWNQQRFEEALREFDF